MDKQVKTVSAEELIADLQGRIDRGEIQGNEIIHLEGTFGFLSTIGTIGHTIVTLK